MKKDRVFAQKQEKIKPFAFTSQVARVFDDMLVRSVPMYQESIQRQSQMTRRFYQDNTRIYDLGCSHGNLGLAVRDAFHGENFSMVGIDSSIPMIQKYAPRLEGTKDPRVELVCGRMEDLAIENASVVLINLTLQFLAAEKRDALVAKIFEGMVPGGLLLLTEKVVHSGDLIHREQLDFYKRFKRENGYSELEISQKRDALEEVLVPDTLDIHFNRLGKAGFTQMDVWLKWFNFAGIMAVKEK